MPQTYRKKPVPPKAQPEIEPVKINWPSDPWSELYTQISKELMLANGWQYPRDTERIRAAMDARRDEWQDAMRCLECGRACKDNGTRFCTSCYVENKL